MPVRAEGVTLRNEHPDDADGVHAVLQEAFGAESRVAELAGALLAHPAAIAPRGFVAVAGGRVVGYVLLTAARLDAPRRLVDVLVLSPLGVAPAVQGQGIGTRLLERARQAARASGSPLLFVEGNPAYYGVRGFGPAAPAGFRRPSLRIPAAAFQVVTLPGYEPWMTGTLVYPEIFWDFDAVGLRPGGSPGGTTG